MSNMRVFTPAQARSAGEERVAKDALRAKNLAEITQELLKEKEEAERNFEDTLSRQQAIAQQWYEEEHIRKKALLEEVERLEDRRRKALMPPLIKAEDIHSVSEELHARKLELDLRDSENEDASRALMYRLDECSTREQDLDSREKRVKRMELGAETQRGQVAEDARKLGVQTLEFQQQMADKETQIAYRESELDARQNLIEERENGFVERENEIRAAMRLLADQRTLLEKGFEELRRLKNTHGSTD